jgi:hypothetical protein
MIDEDALLDYLASILVEAFLDRKVKTDPNFKDPRINKPIHDLIEDSKQRGKYDRKANK